MKTSQIGGAGYEMTNQRVYKKGLCFWIVDIVSVFENETLQHDILGQRPPRIGTVVHRRCGESGQEFYEMSLIITGTVLLFI